MTRRRGTTLALLLVAALSGCLWTPAAPVSSRPREQQPQGSVTGSVDLAALGRSTQAAMANLVGGATVSLIDPSTNQTVATTVTDTTGRFTLNYSFTPGSSPYYLEAAKGLSANGVSKPAARIRTLIQASGSGWLSITNGSVGGVTLDASTTALCAITSLKQALASGQQVTPASLIGKLAVGTPDVFTPVTNCSSSEYQSALSVINGALAQDLDPFAAIVYDSANAAFLLRGGALSLTSTSNLAEIMEGATVTLSGTGFDSVPAYNTVRFNGTPGVVTSASPTQLVVSMRGRTAGTVTVQVGSLIYQGPSYTVAPFAVNDGSTAAGTDNAYQYSPVTAGTGYLYANWPANPNATGYLVKVGTTPGGADVKAEYGAGNVTSCTVNGLSLQGAWASASYYVTATPVFGTGTGTPVTSNGVQVAEAATWDGQNTAGLRNDTLGGYSTNFPAGSNKTQFYGHHYFETVTINSGITTYVQPFGKVDSIGEGASINDVRVQNPKDGWLYLHANTITLNGTIDAAGRGYGGGPGTSASGSIYCGHGGVGGLSGNGGDSNGGQGFGAAGGGGAPGQVGGRGGYFGGAGGGGSDGGVGSLGNDATTDGGGAGANGAWASCGAVTTVSGGLAPYGGGIGYGYDNSGGTGGAGYGAGGGGAGGSTGTGGAGGGGTGGGLVGGTSMGLGWAPGSLAMAYNSAAGVAGRYKAAADTTTDQSWILGSGGSGGNAGHNSALSPEYTAGGGGGAGGGAILMQATTLTIGATGKLLAVGAAGGSGGANNTPGSGGGGGGAGGTIVLVATTLTNQGSLDVRGGTNGQAGGTTPVGCGAYAGGNGGNGGASTSNGGTIKVFYRSFGGAMPTLSTAGRVYYATF